VSPPDGRSAPTTSATPWTALPTRLMGELRWMLGLLRQSVRVLAFTCSTTVLGVKVCWRVGSILRDWRAAFGDELTCPRGHVQPAHGIFLCACTALHEGHVFGKCRICQRGAAWTECDTCHLPIRNPWA